MLSYFRGMYTNIIKKKFHSRTLQTREIKKFPLFSEHTSYMYQDSILKLSLPNFIRKKIQHLFHSITNSKKKIITSKLESRDLANSSYNVSKYYIKTNITLQNAVLKI